MLGLGGPEVWFPRSHFGTRHSCSSMGITAKLQTFWSFVPSGYVKTAIEHGPVEIVDKYPLKMVIFHSYGTVYQRVHIFTQTLRLCFEMIWNIWMVANISQIRPKSMLMFHARASKRERYIYIYISDNEAKRCAYWYNLVLIVLYLWVCVYIYIMCMLIYTLHLYIHMCLSLCAAISNMSWLAGGEGGLKGWPCLPVAGFQLPGDQRLLSSYHESMFFFSQW